ncbi:unnamed protein product [Chondrus crispus]|uniref:Uncharacterized protein n=1 Tax=Chondrus crispus TaxID=2769 RepID=R7Q8G3_CHOCR|nr:unnamed protein product [Chondrus crispus]CDF33770.1 unnamed protein product [Chondrus crispus]|eukprot:XP_005713589.1 unnamed protein product [Chondrus crispus]
MFTIPNGFPWRHSTTWFVYSSSPSSDRNSAIEARRHLFAERNDSTSFTAMRRSRTFICDSKQSICVSLTASDSLTLSCSLMSFPRQTNRFPFSAS